MKRYLETGNFEIYRYYIGGISEKVTEVSDWGEYERWEMLLRQAYRRQDEEWEKIKYPYLGSE